MPFSNLLDDIGGHELQSSEEFLLCQLRQPSSRDALVTPPRIFLGLRARAEPFFPEPFLLDKWRVGFMRRANLLGDRRFLDLVGIMLL